MTSPRTPSESLALFITLTREGSLDPTYNPHWKGLLFTPEGAARVMNMAGYIAAVVLLQEMLALPENSDAIIANAQNNYSDDDIVVNNDALVTQNSEGDYWVEAWCFVRNTDNVEIP